MRILNTLFLLFLTINSPLAEKKNTTDNMKEYDIEIIIFEDAHARYINSETWNKDVPDDVELPPDITISEKPTENLDELSLNEINATAYETLEPKILSNEYKRINSSSEYNVLFYSAWRQTGLDETNAFEIDINELVNTHTGKSENSISGNLKVVLARYLHFYADLDYQRQDDKKNINTDTADATTDSSTQAKETDDDLIKQSYPIQSHRRMRSKELHYIDHPLVGLLIQINPVEKIEQIKEP